VFYCRWAKGTPLRRSERVEAHLAPGTWHVAPGTWHLPHGTCAGFLAGTVARVKGPTSTDGFHSLLRSHAPAGAPAAGVRLCRAALMQPHVAAWSFRARCKPLAKSQGVHDSSPRPHPADR